jgi:hypothetical protein
VQVRRNAREPGLGRRYRRPARGRPIGAGPVKCGNDAATLRGGGIDDGGVRHAADGRHLFPVRDVFALPARARVVQIDIDGSLIGLRIPAQAAMTADFFGEAGVLTGR